MISGLFATYEKHSENKPIMQQKFSKLNVFLLSFIYLPSLIGTNKTANIYIFAS